MKRKVLLVAISVLGLFAAAAPANAWTNPSANPATGGGSVVAEQDSPANSIYIKSNGNIGIGNVTNPAEKLDVAGNAKIAGTIKIYNSGTQVGEITTSDTTWFRLNQNIAKNIYTPQYFQADGGFYVDDTSHGINGSGVLVTASLSGTYSSAVTLSSTSNSFTGSTISTTGASYLATSSGNVGVGTATANSKLTVAGTVESTTGGVKFPDGTTQVTAASGATINSANVSAGDFGANTGGGNYSFSGNLSVGSSSSVARLYVVGGAGSLPAMSGTTQSGSEMRIQSNSSNEILDIGSVGGGGGAWFQNTNAVDLSVNYPILLNPNGGNVGVGLRTAPGEKLEVDGNVKINEYRIKRISATSMGVYDSTNTVMLEFDEAI